MTDDDVRAIVIELMSRPKHEKVRSLVYKLLTDGLGVPSTEISFEHGFEVRGRIDALLGATIFEFKSALQSEMGAVLRKMPQYIEDREKVTAMRFTGIATDGAEFIPYRLTNGKLEALSPYTPERHNPRGLLDWLSQVVSLGTQLEPSATIVRRELGRESLAFEVARSELIALWQLTATKTDVALKRDIWSGLLELVYGSRVDTDDLWFQHTYLTIVAKAMALSILGVPPQSPREMLDGTPFRNASIGGAVESDFFDWVLETPEGDHVVRQIVSQASRFKLDKVEHDVLKDLYESLIDPEQRHDLGEYYTPDWLAAEVYSEAVDDVLTQRVLDPSCGSGTFLFHAVRAVLDAADQNKMSSAEAVDLCSSLVCGIDIHPVAVIIARVVFLMAIGPKKLRHRNAISIPVYLGDSLQWNTQTVLAQKSIRISVPSGPSSLVFPEATTKEPAAFDATIDAILRLSEAGARKAEFRTWLEQNRKLDRADQDVLVSTYGTLRDLQSQGKNHVWGYVARNLSRPIWLSSKEQQVDRIVGNPPWLAYRYMSDVMQSEFRTEAARLGVSTFGQGSSSQQDLSAYFFARCVELYAKPNAKIAFILPYAVLSRKQYRKFLTGTFSSKVALGVVKTRMRRVGKKGARYRSTMRLFAQVSFDQAWTLTERAQPVFKVPSCVLFATAQEPTPLPSTVTDFSGTLHRRDSTRAEARSVIKRAARPWPIGGSAVEGYAKTFRAGAIIFPIVFFRVAPVQSSPLGINAAAPVVESRRSALEKKPWKSVRKMQGPVEEAYLYELFLGESIAPYVTLDPILAVVPRNPKTGMLMDAVAARKCGALHLARWMGEAEKSWTKFAKKPAESLAERLDFYGQLSSQFPIPEIRLLYSASGTRLSAAILRRSSAIVEHKLYWADMQSIEEARYLEAILNSDVAKGLIDNRRSRGLWGPRDFDKVVFLLPIPPYAGTKEQDSLVELARKAEQVAASAVAGHSVTRVGALKLVRRALADAGLSSAIDGLVAQLLGTLTS